MLISIDVNLSGDQRDVRRVEDLRPVGQALGPQLRRRIEGVRVAAAEPHLGAEPLPDEVLHLKRTVVGLQDVLHHLAVPVRFRGRHRDGVHRVEADVDDDSVVLLDEVFVRGEAHLGSNYLTLEDLIKFSCFDNDIYYLIYMWFSAARTHCRSRNLLFRMASKRQHSLLCAFLRGTNKFYERL